MIRFLHVVMRVLNILKNRQVLCEKKKIFMLYVYVNVQKHAYKTFYILTKFYDDTLKSFFFFPFQTGLCNIKSQIYCA